MSAREYHENFMKSSDKIIKRTTKRLYVQALAKRKQWTEEQTVAYVREYVTSGTTLSLFAFLNAR